VTFAIAAPLPTITIVTNAASFATGEVPLQNPVLDLWLFVLLGALAMETGKKGSNARENY
jgi:hypothetical protein